MSHRFAIIGCGNIASRHAEQIKATGQLVAVCDIDETKARRFAIQYDATAYCTIAGLLEKEHPDIVVVCTPNGTHARLCIQSLQAGCHVLCEKPLSISAKDGVEMIKTARKAGKRLFVVKQNRYNPPVVLLKKLLDEGRLGEIQSFQVNCFWNRPDEYYQNSWRGTKHLDGGILYTQFSHFIDLLYWFLGEIKAVSGWRCNYQHINSIEFEDTGVANLVMQNSSIGTISYTINAHASNMEGSFTIFGRKGTVKIGGQYLNRIDYFSVENESPPSEENSSAANNYGYYLGSMSNHHIVYKELTKTLNDSGHKFLEASEALKSVEMIEQIYAGSPFIPISSLS